MTRRFPGRSFIVLGLSSFLTLQQAFTNGFSCAYHQGCRAQTVSHATQATILSLARQSDEEIVEEARLRILQAGQGDFWDQQKELAQEMTSSSTNSLRQEQLKKFEKRRLALVGDTAYFGVLIVCFLWIIFADPATSVSYGVGASLGVAYAYGLGKSVEQLGVMPDEADGVERSGFGEARFAFLLLLFVIVSKFRSEGLQELPAIGGFFTYQLASLKQGLQEIND